MKMENAIQGINLEPPHKDTWQKNAYNVTWQKNENNFEKDDFQFSGCISYVNIRS